MGEENKHISDLLTRYVNGLYTRNDIETLRQLASSATKRAELESEMDRVWNEVQNLLDKTRKREKEYLINHLGDRTYTSLLIRK